jgi:hypothetical protein
VRALTEWYGAAGLSVGLAIGDSITGHTWLRVWAVLAAILAIGLWVKRRDEAAEQRYQDYVQRWAHQPFQAGWDARGVSEQIKQRT